MGIEGWAARGKLIMKKRKKSQRDNADRDEWTESERQTEHKIRMRFEFQDLVEDLIQEGLEHGVFDNLKGKGKPLNLKANLYEGDSKLAHELMKEHQILPLWLAKRNVVKVTIEEFRQDIGRRWQRHEQAYRLATDEGRRNALSLSWRAQCRVWEGEIKEINKLIDDFNLRRPSEGMEIFKLQLAEELVRAGAGQELG
jgi:DnaJ family protein C protein 28